MKKILSFFTHPIVISAFGMLLLGLLVWFVGPMIKFGEANSAPLASQTTRLLIIMAIITLWGLNNLRVQMMASKNNSALVEDLEKAEKDNAVAAGNEQSAEEVAQLAERFNQALGTLKKLKFSGVGKSKALYELPWYIIVGPPGSGKTTALVNSGLEFPLAEQFGKGALQGVGGTRNCDWWFTNSAVLIDTAGRYTTQDSHKVIDGSAWEGFLNLLKRNRRRRPINGAIVSISLQDLLTQTEQERIQHAKTIRTRLDELMEKLEIRFPVYLMFTKVDMVSGFREFFEDMNREDREQVWGVSLPDAPKPNDSPDFDYFTTQFNALVARLYDRVLWFVHQERNVKRRANIYAFPQQMENIKSITDSFVRQTFASNRFKYQPYLRGVYLTSGTQDGTPIDRLMSAVTGTFGFSREAGQATAQEGKSYFLNRLFQDVIFPESDLVGSNARYEAFIKWGRRTAYVGFAALITTLFIVWSGGVARHNQLMAEVVENLATFKQEEQRAGRWNKDIRAVLPPLNALARASVIYDQDDKPWLSRVGMYDASVDKNAGLAYHTHLEEIYLPRLLNVMEVELAKGHEGGDLYNNFRIYMMFKKTEKRKPALIQAWFAALWAKQYPGEATRRTELAKHLENLLALDLPPATLDKRTVTQTRNQLLRVPVAKRVYARIKTNESLMREISVLNYLGESARNVFKIDAAVTQALTLPYLFTIDGFNEVEFSANSNVFADVVNERWVLDDDNSKRVDFVEDDLDALGEEVKELYFAEYIGIWRNVLRSLQLADFRNLNQANEVLMSFVDPVYSPMRAALNIAVENTQLTPPVPGEDLLGKKGKGKAKKAGALAGKALAARPLTKVDKFYKDLHMLVHENSQGLSSMDVWFQRVEEMQQYLAEIALAPDPGQKAFEIARARYQSGAGNPIASLKAYAKNAPEPLEGWIKDMTNQSWRIVMITASGYVNTQWRNEVYAPYSRALAGRYPLKAGVNDELALFDFIAFFKPGGQLDTFQSTYIKPFVKTSAGKWVNRGVDGYGLGFSSSAMAQIRRGLQIRDAFFRSNPESPTIQVELKPRSMNEQDARFTLDIGETRLTYSHGPKFWKSVTWSGADEGKRMRVAIEDLDGIQYEQSYSGAWAWFRMMDASHVTSTNRSNVYQIKFVAKDGSGKESREMIYEGKTKSIDNNPFSSRMLTAFSVPESL